MAEAIKFCIRFLAPRRLGEQQRQYIPNVGRAGVEDELERLRRPIPRTDGHGAIVRSVLGVTLVLVGQGLVRLPLGAGLAAPGGFGSLLLGDRRVVRERRRPPLGEGVVEGGVDPRHVRAAVGGPGRDVLPAYGHLTGGGGGCGGWQRQRPGQEGQDDGGLHAARAEGADGWVAERREGRGCVLEVRTRLGSLRA